MARGCYSMVATVLLLMNLERTRSVKDSCDKCEAGTFCEKSQGPSCTPCPPESYSSTNGQRTCDICKRCEGIFQIKKPCSSTSNAQCECISGYHCLGSECSRCEPDCRPGQGLTKDGCKDCYVGTFNDQKGGICQPWTNCSLNGTTVHMNGTKIKDVVCGSTTKHVSPLALAEGHSLKIVTFFLALTLATLLFLVLFVILWLLITKSMFSVIFLAFITPVQMAQQEDACSCRFPEEEEGGCEL
uniref:Tumor necrosis factor receptor superfamily, member 9 n=1 Tax=Jaculus jaculus TaxID=51337 RepID=A0A8C5KLM4_JACJA